MKKQGFTIVELVFVMVVIIVLSIFLIPGLRAIGIGCDLRELKVSKQEVEALDQQIAAKVMELVEEKLKIAKAKELGILGRGLLEDTRKAEKTFEKEINDLKEEQLGIARSYATLAFKIKDTEQFKKSGLLLFLIEEESSAEEPISD